MSSAELTSKMIKRKRMLNLVFATATLLVLGLIYAWSIFAVPIGKTFGSYGPYLSQVFQVSMFSFCFAALLGAQIIKKFSAKASIVVAAVLLAIGFSLTALFAGLSIWALFIFYGILVGSGCGIGFNAIITLVNTWFPDRVGFSSGVMMMGFGISSLVFGSLANVLFGILDWGIVFMLIAMLTFTVMFILAFVVKPAPEDIGSRLGVERASAQTKTSFTQQKFILKTRVFWVFSIWSVFVVASGLALIGTAAQGAAVLELDEKIFVGFGALMVGLVASMNGLSRIVSGVSFDKVGLLPVMLAACVLCFLCMVGLSLSLAFKIGPLYIVAGILVALAYGSVPVMGASFSRQRFGSQNFAMNLGIFSCCIAVAATINIIITAFLGSPAGDNGSLIYGILAFFTAVAFVGTLVFGKLYKADLASIDEELS
ncbi:MAG: MFS transporter [Coriobacteriia bacterium]|nr:MFS transporter [Coriobacteriia bacterium]